MKKSEKERLIRKFHSEDTSYEEYPRINKKIKENKKKQEDIKEEDLNDYRKRLKDESKEDVLKRLLHLEAFNLYQEKIIKNQEAIIRNLKIEKEELLNRINE